MRLPDRQLSRAVVIGISEYSDENLSQLEAVSETVRALHTTLTDPVHGILPPEHCALLTNEGDLRRIGSALRTAAADAEDLLLVYYSGHGLIGGVRQDLYLALSDSDFEAPEYNSLEYDKLRSTVLASSARTKVIVLDCCFAGRALSAAMGGSEDTYTGQIEIGGTYVLTAAPRDKVALILEGEKHTAFTGRLLQLLNEGAPGGAELLTIDEIYRLLY
ncbi:MAG: caspase family protein, partial [Catenulispora sp.]|nr:caspase family protein [Catenulispora sp.]